MAHAYVCHLEDHWFTIRKIGTTWFILNSLFKGPRIVSESFVELYITQLYTEGFLFDCFRSAENFTQFYNRLVNLCSRWRATYVRSRNSSSGILERDTAYKEI